ncbi:hypothetical protein [Microbacterium sp. NPDC077184]|uniref:hypothetical protein n=1 Tax=Microbacterium sp. NPDC077184 TaxID=3154764 RepID=UPI003440EBC3
MNLSTPRVVTVREGLVQPSGSWLYVWIDIDTGVIAYVGGTGFDPELRAYLHVESQDPRVGRVRSTVPLYDQRGFDVLAFALPDGIDRPAARAALIALLAEAGLYPGENGAAKDLREVTDPIVQAIERRRQMAARESDPSQITRDE